jgi:tetratricopeptide (TPR) repeat protein
LTVALLSGQGATAADPEQDKRMLAQLEAIRLQKAAVKDGRFDVAGADKAYAAAFRAYGIDIDKLEPAQAADKIRSRAIRIELAVALDDWAMARRAAGKAKDKGWQRLIAVSQAADPDPWRVRLRDALVKRDGKALKELAAADVAALPPTTAVLLGDALASTGAVAEAVAVLRKAQRRHPADFWINHQLGSYLMQVRPARLEEAVGFYRAALALQPQNPGVLLNLGTALQARGKPDEAIAAYRQAIRLQPDFAPAHLNLGSALRAKGQLDEAVAAYRQAIRLQPSLGGAFILLGDALADQGKLDEAIAAYRHSLQSDAPDKCAGAHFGLGKVLAKQGKQREAETCFRKAIELRPDWADAYHQLALVLQASGRPAEAQAALKRANELDAQKREKAKK